MCECSKIVLVTFLKLLDFWMADGLRHAKNDAGHYICNGIINCFKNNLIYLLPLEIVAVHQNSLNNLTVGAFQNEATLKIVSVKGLA